MEIKALDDIEVTRDIKSRAFGPMSDSEWAQGVRSAAPGIAARRSFGGFEGDRLVATARIHDMRQWWNGRPVSMAGIGGVSVAPEDRGRGIGRRMMTYVLERCASFGHPISVLFPATTQLYRSLGWEHVGARYWATVSADLLRTLRAEPVPVRRAGPEDAEEVAAMLRRVHESARDDGPLDWTVDMWRVFLDDDDAYHYLAEDGLLSYNWAENNAVLEVGKVVAGSERTLRAFLAIVGSGSSIAKQVRISASPFDPVLWLLRERHFEEDLRRSPWMLRVVDAPAALAARGYPAAVSAEVTLKIDDAQVAANSGFWRLTVEKGQGRLEPAAADSGAVRLGAPGLGALYGGIPMATLLQSGLAQGGDRPAHDTLNSVFAARPFIIDNF